MSIFCNFCGRMGCQKHNQNYSSDENSYEMDMDRMAMMDGPWDSSTEEEHSSEDGIFCGEMIILNGVCTDVNCECQHSWTEGFGIP